METGHTAHHTVHVHVGPFKAHLNNECFKIDNEPSIQSTCTRESYIFIPMNERGVPK